MRNVIFPKPFDLDLLEFIHGPQHVEKVLKKETEFDGTFLELWNRMYVGINDCTSIPGTKRYVSCKDLSFCYSQVSDGVVLTDYRNQLVGFYIRDVVAVSEHHRESGFGKELIIMTCLIKGVNPAWEYGEPSYTERGRVAHVRAWTAFRRHPERYEGIP